MNIKYAVRFFFFCLSSSSLLSTASTGIAATDSSKLGANIGETKRGETEDERP